MAELNENVIEWFDGDDTIAVTLHQKRFVNRVRKLAEQSENVVILAENPDGSIFAHLPLNYLKLSPKAKNNITVERKAELVEQVRKAREAKQMQREAKS